MPDITLTFPSLNFSAQVGDIVYYTANPENDPNNMQENGCFQFANQLSYSETNLGPIISITTGVGADGVAVAGGTSVNIVWDVPTTTEIPNTSNYVFIVKNNVVNTTGLLGYYGEFEFQNTATTQAELFSVACEVSESSK